MKLTKHLPEDSVDYKVVFFYDFLDDTYNDWSPDGDDLEDDQKSIITAMSAPEIPNDGNKLTPTVVTLLEKKRNHPLNIMVSIPKKATPTSSIHVTSITRHQMTSF